MIKVLGWESFWCVNFPVMLLRLFDDRQCSDFGALELRLDLLHRNSPSTVDNVATMHIGNGFIQAAPLTVEYNVALSYHDLEHQIG